MMLVTCCDSQVWKSGSDNASTAKKSEREKIMLNSRKVAIAKNNASIKRHANIFTGCLALGTLKQVHKKVKALKIAGRSVSG